MSVRVRFSSEQPGVAFVPATPSPSTGLIQALFSKPMPPLHRESNFAMDCHTAASIGDVRTLEELLQKQGRSSLSPNLSSWTPLLYAAYLGHHAVCSLLIENNVKIDDTNNKGQTALMLAAACGNVNVVRVLLSAGASVDRADMQGRQPLHFASACSQNVVTDLLLSAGADANARDLDGTTPVMEACASAHELTLMSLLDKGGDPWLRNSRGEDGAALAGENQNVLKLLREKAVGAGGGGYVVEPCGGNNTISSLSALLDAMNLARYMDRLQRENIDLSLFFSLTEKDLDEMEVAYGPKKKMLSVIDRYRSTGVISIDGYDEVLAARFPPVYEGTSKESEGSSEMATLRLVRRQNEGNKKVLMELLQLIGSGASADRTRPLLISAIDGVESIAAALARHPA